MKAITGAAMTMKRMKFARPSEMSASDFMTFVLTSSSDFHCVAYLPKHLRPLTSFQIAR